MSEFFLKIVNMSISASWIVLAVLILRLLLKKAPKWITVLLWGIVAVRLICPFSIESVMSLIPSAETVSPQIMTQSAPSIDSGIPIINEAVNPIINEMANPVINNPSTAVPEPSISPLQILIPILSIIWVVGIVVMIAYTIISYINVKIKIGTAVRLCDNIYQSEGVASPFVLGTIKPKIYLPFNMSENDMEHVIAHERAHLHRRDHLWKPLGFLILTIHWFNPLMWISYILLCRDIELACDEKVIKKLNTEKKADYSQALLTCSVSRRSIAACPIAFGEVSVKDRVKSVLSYKKPTIWIIIAAVISTVVVAVCFLTNPIGSNNTRLLKVLNNEAKVIDEAGQSVYLKDYKIGERRDISLTPQKYTFVDFDNDGTDEMVISDHSNYGAYIVFRIYNRKVYGFAFNARELIALKKDGTFLQSSSAFDELCAGLTFEKNAYKIVEKAYENNTDQEFRIEGKAVSSPDVYEYISEFYDKEDVVWKQCQSDENKIDYKSIYNRFLDGEITAVDKDGNKKTVIEYLDQTMYGYNEDYGYSYTFCDMTNDGVPELCIGHQFSLVFFTIKNGQVHYWYGKGMWTVWLSNGAFLYKHPGAAPINRVYRYYELDENGYEKFSVDFSWWDVAYKDDPELYEYHFDGQEVSKKEWEEKTEKYLKYDVVDDGRVWYNKS